MRTIDSSVFLSTRSTFAIVTLFLWGAGAHGEDWSQWRGPRRDGCLTPAKGPLPLDMAPRQVWKVTVGEGHSSPIVADGRVYQFARQGDNEVLVCLELLGGKEAWRAEYAAPYEVNRYAESHGKWPKSTPAVQGDRVCTLGISGILSCYDAKTGNLKWRKDFSAEYPGTSPLYGTAMSPVIEGTMCIAHVGGHNKGSLRAFDLEKGKVKWSWDDDGPAYSSPVLAELAGERQLVTQSQKQILGIAPSSGKVLWSIPFTTEYDQNAVTVLVHKDLVIYSGLDQGVRALRVSREVDRVAVKEAWQNTDLAMYLSSPVLEGGKVFGFSHKRDGEFFCLDPSSGAVLWRGPPKSGENAALVNVGGTLACLTNKGTLLVLKADAKEYKLVAQHKVADTPTWAHPAFVEGGFLVKDKTSLALWSW